MDKNDSSMKGARVGVVHDQPPQVLEQRLRRIGADERHVEGEVDRPAAAVQPRGDQPHQVDQVAHVPRARVAGVALDDQRHAVRAAVQPRIEPAEEPARGHQLLDRMPAAELAAWVRFSPPPGNRCASCVPRTKAQDPEIKPFATATPPLLRDHLQMAPPLEEGVEEPKGR